MKYLSFYLTAFCITISLSLFAQSPQHIEADLLKSFKKIDYWHQKANDTTVSALAANDSLANANDIFARMLKHNVEKFPTLITDPFNVFKRQYLNISTSTDKMFRIYSWDTETGGTMHIFENVMQYRSGTKIKAIIDTPRSEGDVSPCYDKIYTFKTGNKTYYLTRFSFIESTRYSAYGITAFTIENDNVVEAKIMKIRSGMHSALSYECDFSLIDIKTYERLPEIRFNNATNSIYLPLVDKKGKITLKIIHYKFTGQYFERMKN